MDDSLVFNLIMWLPSIVLGGLFVISFVREPRRLRNALYLTLSLLCTVLVLALYHGQGWMLVFVVLLLGFYPLVSVVALVVDGIIVVRRMGVSTQTLLPWALSAAILFDYLAPMAASALDAPAWLLSILNLFGLECAWFCFTLVSLLLYSWLYRIIPRRHQYDYIVIHGAGLSGCEPSPVLASRIDKALSLWEAQGRRAVFVASGGQGADEEVSEAEAMRRYLVRHGVPEAAILCEDRSTTTRENLAFSKELMDARSGFVTSPNGVGRAASSGPRLVRRASVPYRAAVVSSDYHVFRCAEYARELGLAADGIGSHTRGWAWPPAFIREFLALTRTHWLPYAFLAALWAIIQVSRLAAVVAV